MTQPPPSAQRDQVESPVKSGQIGPGTDKGLGRARDAGLLTRGQGMAARIQGSPGFDLDKHQGAALRGNQIDFAGGGAGAPCDDAVSLQAQPKGGPSFSLPALRFRALSVFG